MKVPVSKALQSAMRTPLRKIGELPDELILACMSGLSEQLTAPVIARWSSQLSQKRIVHSPLI